MKVRWGYCPGHGCMRWLVLDDDGRWRACRSSPEGANAYLERLALDEQGTDRRAAASNPSMRDLATVDAELQFLTTVRRTSGGSMALTDELLDERLELMARRRHAERDQHWPARAVNFVHTRQRALHVCPNQDSRA